MLLVEDDLSLSGYLASALKGAGYWVQTAHDREQAIGRERQESFHRGAARDVLDIGIEPAVLDHCVDRAG